MIHFTRSKLSRKGLTSYLVLCYSIKLTTGNETVALFSQMNILFDTFCVIFRVKAYCSVAAVHIAVLILHLST